MQFPLRSAQNRSFKLLKPKWSSAESNYRGITCGSSNASSRGADCTIPLFSLREAVEPFGSSAKLRDRGWRSLPPEVHREVHASEARVPPLKMHSKRRCKMLHTAPAEAAISFPARETSLLLEREDTRDFFPF